MTTTAERRVEAIEAYGVLEAPQRRELAALVDLAARLADVPKATINLITEDEQRQVATVGFTGSACARVDSFCNTTVAAERAVLVEDARLDPRFADNPHTTGELDTIRFYAAHPLITPDGVTIGTLCVFDNEPHPITAELAGGLELLADRVVDVLELELASRRLAQANARLARSNERLAAFAGQVSHDLKNPLVAISMALEMVEADLADAGIPEVPLVRGARRAADRMHRLVRDLLDFALIGGHPVDEPVDLAAEVETVLDDLSSRLSRDHVTVRELPVVRGDVVHLRAVLQNLLDNAAKFTAAGRDPEITLSAERLDGRARIEVADRGPGIPEPARERIFEPLTRLHPGVEGSGIGLATCRRVIEAHCGRIGVRDNPGGGTVAWFELPLADG